MLGGEELEVLARQAIIEEAFAFAENYRNDEEANFVEEVLLQEFPAEFRRCRRRRYLFWISV